jgi:hypothetical protein
MPLAERSTDGPASSQAAQGGAHAISDRDELCRKATLCFRLAGFATARDARLLDALGRGFADRAAELAAAERE